MDGTQSVGSPKDVEEEENKMKFDKTCKVIIDSMNRDEAKAFILFLESEIARHGMDIDNARDLIYTVSKRFGLLEVKLDDTKRN